MRNIFKKIFFICSWIKKIVILKINSNIQYRIIDYSAETNIVALQCNITRAFFQREILSVVLDYDVISYMHPEQACFLGIMAGLTLKKRDMSLNNLVNKNQCTDHHKNDQNNLIFDRYGSAIFIHPVTQKLCVMRPDLIVSRSELINLFHPVIACTLGLNVGIKKLMASEHVIKKARHLRLISNA